MASNRPKLTLFYDGLCPLCRHEIQFLQRHNHACNVLFVDLNSPNMSQNYAQIDIEDAMATLLAITDTGETLRGIDANYAVWSAVGKGHWLAPLRWPLIRPIAQLAYRLFAKHRSKITALLTGAKPCQSCETNNKQPEN